MTGSAIEKVSALYSSTLQNIEGVCFVQINFTEHLYQNIFGELSSSRSIQGDRYLQGHHTQIHLTVVFLLPTLGWSYTFFSKYVLLSKQKRGKCILLFSPSCT